jgi:hypothetical protein
MIFSIPLALLLLKLLEPHVERLQQKIEGSLNNNLLQAMKVASENLFALKQAEAGAFVLLPTLFKK